LRSCEEKSILGLPDVSTEQFQKITLNFEESLQKNVPTIGRSWAAAEPLYLNELILQRILIKPRNLKLSAEFKFFKKVMKSLNSNPKECY
jgi:hypothetical protein